MIENALGLRHAETRTHSQHSARGSGQGFATDSRSSPGNHEPYVVHVRNHASVSSGTLPGSFPIVAPRHRRFCLVTVV
jgi:hypothetical protein